MAEDMGFEAYWLGEHHFGPHGMGNIPNPILVGADLAARTKRIRIGQLANIAVWWHPLRLAEDLAVLDNLTKGRIEVGFGRGIWPYEGPQFHPNADPRKGDENRELFEEVIEVVKKAWTEDFFSHKGELPVSGGRHQFLPPEIRARPHMAGREPGPQAQRDAEAVSEAAPASLDDRIDGQVRSVCGEVGAEALLLAAAATAPAGEVQAVCGDAVGD